MQIRLVYTPESLQARPECCPCSLAGVAVHLTDAISSRIPCPLVHAVNERREEMIALSWVAGFL